MAGISPDAKFTYNFNDPRSVSGQAYYRIRMVEGDVHKYSKIILLSSKLEFTIRNLVNPFGSQISFDIVSPERGKANVQLIDLYGRTVKQSQMNIVQGMNEVFLHNLNHLSSGMYVLRIQIGEKIITKQVLKTNPGH